MHCNGKCNRDKKLMVGPDIEIRDVTAIPQVIPSNDDEQPQAKIHDQGLEHPMREKLSEARALSVSTFFLSSFFPSFRLSFLLSFCDKLVGGRLKRSIRLTCIHYSSS